MEHNDILIIAGVVFLGIFCQWFAWRMKIPAIVPLLAGGFLIGPVFGWIQPQEMLGDLFFPVVSLLVAIILFEGALTLEWQEVRSVASAVRNLITVGAVITWVGAATAAHYLLGMSWELAILFGSLIVVTGPTVIAPLLRNVRPTAKVASVLKWESILIDPLGALFAVLVFDFIVADGAAGELSADALIGFLAIVVTGTVAGLLGGVAVGQIVKRYLVPDYLRDVTVLAVVLLVFSVSDTIRGESGLLAVTVMGVYLANSGLHQLREVWYFKEKLSVLFISVLFLALAASVEMADLMLLDWRSLILLGIVIFVIRPVGVQLSALGSNLSARERLFVSWVAPRGIVAAAVTALFAYRLLELGYEEAALLEPLVFLVIVGTVAVQGFTARPVAKWLGVAEAEPQGFLIMGADRLAQEIGLALQRTKLPVRLLDVNRDNVAQARLRGLDAAHGDVLSEWVETHVDLSGIGRLLALTRNDEANAIACKHFEDEFGSSEVYQLPPKPVRPSEAGTTPNRFQLGRLLFAQGATHEQLDGLLAREGTVKATPLTPQFTFADFQEQYAGRYTPVMAIRERRVVIATVDEPLQPTAGWTILSLISPTPAVVEAPQRTAEKSFA